jgi:hypothetical protein
VSVCELVLFFPDDEVVHLASQKPVPENFFSVGKDSENTATHSGCSQNDEMHRSLAKY